MNKTVSRLVKVALAMAIGSVIYLDHRNSSGAGKARPALLNPIVRLVAPNGRTYCTGTVINPTTVVTASHCIMMQDPVFGMPFANPDPIGIRANDNVDRNTTARVYAIQVQLDHAVLKGNFPGFQYAMYITDIAEINRTYKRNHSYKACGYPLGGSLYCTELTYKELAVFMWAMNGQVIPGMSGGPVFYGDTFLAINVSMDNDHAIISPIYNLPGVQDNGR